MINKLKENWLLILIFLFVLFFRLIAVFQIEGFTTDAYFNIKHINYISENYKPMSYDELSYGGRDVLISPGFHYILAFFNLFLPLQFVLKFLPELFLAMLVFVVYLISMAITKNKNASLFAALISGFVPLFVERTLNGVSVYSLLLLVMFYMFYCLIKMVEDKKYVSRFVVLSFVLPLIHPTSLVFIFSIIFYIIFLVSEGMEVNNLRKEAFLFSIILILLVEFIIFKRAFLQHGFGLVNYNIPEQIIEDYFRNVTIFSLMAGVGVIPLIFGVVGIYNGVFKTKNRGVLLLTGLILSVLFLLAMKLIDFFIGLMILGIALAVLSSLGISLVYKYISITRFSKYSSYFSYFFIFLVILLSVAPSVNSARNVLEESVSDNELAVLGLIKNDPLRGVVLAGIEGGDLINVVTGKGNVMDTNFLLVDDAIDRAKNIRESFTTSSQAIALENFNKYNIKYIYLSDRVRERYNISQIEYAKIGECFEELGRGEIEAYKIIC